MAAYVLVNVHVDDPDNYREYTRQVPATLEPYQGRFVARGGTCEVLEGEWAPGRVVLIEFPSAEQARAWHASPAYRDILPLRHRHARTEFLAVVEGVPA